MKLHQLTAAAAMIVALSGCASAPPPPPHFTEAAVQTLPSPPADKAQIVFLEPINSIQGMFPVGLFEVTGDSKTHLATTGSHTKAIVNLPPGHHLLMAAQSGIRAHFMEANVAAGKRYYVLVRFIYGNGFQLRPVRTDDSSDYSVKNKDFPTWMSSTRIVEMTPESVQTFEKLKPYVDKVQTEGWKTWNEKTPAQRAELTLNPADAVAY